VQGSKPGIWKGTIIIDRPYLTDYYSEPFESRFSVWSTAYCLVIALLSATTLA